MTRTLITAGLILLAAFAVISIASAEEWINTRLNDDTTNQLQNEQQVVVNPTDPMNAVAVWRDFRLGYRQVGYGYTTDGGQTWINPGLFVDPHYARDSDPALTVSADGTFYAMLLAYTGDTGQENGLLMYRSLDGGATWEDRGFCIDQHPNAFEDKEFIACDRTDSAHHGRIYCVWDRFYETNIYCVSSGDEGDAWTSERRVSDQSSNQFPTPAVGPDGTLYVAWTYFGGRIRIDRSFDGGLTFGNDINVTTVYNPHPTLNGGIGAPAHPAMDVDITGGPYNGRIYIAYINRVSSSDYDIYIRHSDDQGVNWSDARRINDDPFNNGCDQFHPWLTVDNSGVVTTVWLDRRQDPSNWEWHCYLSQSFDGGMTWTPNQQVSTAPSSPSDAAAHLDIEIDYPADRDAKMANGPEAPGWLRRALAQEAETKQAAASGERIRMEPHQDQSRAGLLGEYIGIASYDGYAIAVWTDTRHGNQDTYAGAQDNASGVDDEGSALVASTLRASPNPMRDLVTLRYEVPTDGWVNLEVFDISGRLMRTLVGRKVRSGDAQFVWDGTDQGGRPVTPGTYYARLRAPGVEESVPIVLQR